MRGCTDNCVHADFQKYVGEEDWEKYVKCSRGRGYVNPHDHDYCSDYDGPDND